MAGKGTTGRRGREQVGDERLRARTGRGWEEWFAWLDSRKAHELDHRGIVALVSPEEVGTWYEQMIAVAYEQERGLREVHEKPSGFEIARTKTLTAAARDVWAAFADDRRRFRWLGPLPWKVRTSTPPCRLRVDTEAGRVVVEISALDSGRCRVSVRNTGLDDARAAERQKAFWSEKLSELKQWVEH